LKKNHYKWRLREISKGRQMSLVFLHQLPLMSDLKLPSQKYIWSQIYSCPCS
jgi:hypothetical protein